MFCFVLGLFVCLLWVFCLFVCLVGVFLVTISSPTRTLKWPGRNHAQITCNTSCAYHMQHVVFRASRYEGRAQVLGLTEFKLHLL